MSDISGYLKQCRNLLNVATKTGRDRDRFVPEVMATTFFNTYDNLEWVFWTKDEF